MEPALDVLSPADRGFVTWLATMLREPVEPVWTRLAPVASVTGDQLAALDLTPIGPRLRFAAGPRKLSMPIAGLDALEELDCSGLDLDLLDVRLLTRLRVLRCADNRLRELDLVASPRLEVLDCARNHLMVLDLRANPALREVACGDNDLGLLVLAQPSPDDALEVLDASRNQLMVLSLGDRPRLRRVRADHNALARVEIGDAPALRELDLSRNDLDRIALSGAPGLERLHLARNRLPSCDVSALPALRELRCHGNFVAALELGACPALEVVDAHHNQLEAISLGPASALVELDLADNRLTALSLGAPALLQLDVARNQLGELQLAGCPRLRSLDVSGNPLARLDPRPAPELVELRAANTRIATLDIRGNPALSRMRAAAPGQHAPRVLATPAQQRRLTELRTHLGLGTGATSIADLDPYELHDLALSIGNRDPEQRLLAVVTAPQCDLGTALMVYWTSSPHYYRRYTCREEVPAYEQAGWDLLAAIEARVVGGGFDSAEIAFDPTDDRQTRSIRGVDWTRAPAMASGYTRSAGEAHRRELPARLQEAVPPFDRGGRAPGA
jgi:Leucine-rich repeat (LRR) protein